MSTRHRWVKVAPHKRICQKCGTGKVNKELGPNQWETTYHKPDGTSVVSTRVTPCEAGPKSNAYLTKYANAIACAHGAAPIETEGAEA